MRTDGPVPELGPMVIDVPVRGDWIAPHTPGSGVPSHGTALFGESHAIDFVMVKGKKPYRASVLEYAIHGLPLNRFYGWGQPVFSVLDGIVVETNAAVPERNPVKILGDLAYTAHATNAFKKDPADLAAVAGNYVLVKHATNLYALYAHLQTASVMVAAGQTIRSGQTIAKVGHSGNSTMPHLHFQLMDHADHRQAHGVAFVFREYAVWKNNAWIVAAGSLPKKNDLMRFAPA